MNLEQQIINQLFHNDKYGRAILPYLQAEYFVDSGNRVIFEHISKFATKYSNLPTPVAIQIEIDNAELQEATHAAAMEALDIQHIDKPVDYGWLMDQTEKYCQDRAVHNALRESIGILGDKNRASGEIEELLRKALAVSFDTNLGLDVLDDAEQQYELTHGVKAKIPFMIDALNRATEGGVEEKTLNVIMAGCVHPDTPVTIRYEFDSIPRVDTRPIKSIKGLIEDGLEVEIFSPNGFVKVKDYVEKGFYDEYVLRLEDRTLVRCNEDHLFKTNLYGWMTAKEIFSLTQETTEINICTNKGLMKGQVVKTPNVIPIVDIVVDDVDHAYYANGVESHNTNVGKSLILCHLAGDYLLQGKNVVYITLEMAEAKIASRVYGNILNVGLDQQKSMPKEWFLAAIDKVKKTTKGKLKVKEYPSNGANANHFRHYIQELRQKSGFKPDIIIVDYLGICASARYQAGKIQKHQLLQAIAQELRSLGQELGVPVFTAVQVNREGFGSSDPGLTDIAEAWGVTHEADWVLIISQSEDMEALNQFMCRQDKSRYADKDKMRKFVIGVDKNKQRVFDVDESAALAHTNTSANSEDETQYDAFGKFAN